MVAHERKLRKKENNEIVSAIRCLGRDSHRLSQSIDRNVVASTHVLSTFERVGEEMDWQAFERLSLKMFGVVGAAAVIKTAGVYMLFMLCTPSSSCHKSFLSCCKCCL